MPRNKKRKQLPLRGTTKTKKKSKDTERESEPPSHAAIALEPPNDRESEPPSHAAIALDPLNERESELQSEQESDPPSDATIASENTATMNETHLKERKNFYELITKQNFFTHKALVKYPLRDYKEDIVKWLNKLNSGGFPNCNAKNDLVRKWKVVNNELYSNKKENKKEELPITAYEDIYETILKVDMQQKTCSNAELGFLVSKKSGNITKQMVQYYCTSISGRRIANKREKKHEENNGKQGKIDERNAKIEQLKSFMSRATAAYYVQNPNLATLSDLLNNDTIDTTTTKDNSPNMEITTGLDVVNNNDTHDTTSKDKEVASKPVRSSITCPQPVTITENAGKHTDSSGLDVVNNNDTHDTTSKDKEVARKPVPSSKTCPQPETITGNAGKHTEPSGLVLVNNNYTHDTTSKDKNVARKPVHSSNTSSQPLAITENAGNPTEPSHEEKNNQHHFPKTQEMTEMVDKRTEPSCVELNKQLNLGTTGYLDTFKKKCKEIRSNNQEELQCEYFVTFHGLFNSESMHICWMNSLAIIMFYQLSKCVVHNLKTSWERNYPAAANKNLNSGDAQDVCAKKIDEFTAHAYNLITILLTKNSCADKSLGNTDNANLPSCDQLVATFLEINKERVNTLYPGDDDEELREDAYMEQGVDHDVCELAQRENLLRQFNDLDPTIEHYSVPKYTTLYESDEFGQFQHEENDGLFMFYHKSHEEWNKGFKKYKEEVHAEVLEEFLSGKTAKSKGKKKRSATLPNHSKNKKWQKKRREKENNFVLDVTPKQIVKWVFGDTDIQQYQDLPEEVQKELRSGLSDEMNVKIDQEGLESVGTFKRSLCIQYFPHILCFQMVGSFHEDIMSGHDDVKHKNYIYSQQYNVKNHNEIVQVYDKIEQPTRLATYKVCGMIMRIHRGIECDPDGHYIAVVRTRCDDEKDEKWMFHDDHHKICEIKDINKIQAGDSNEDYMPVMVFMRKLEVEKL